MKCPYCGQNELKVVDKRNSDDKSIWRRRECLKCGKRFTTYERVETVDLIVIKKDGRRERFDRNKLKTGILKACEKRPVTNETIEKIVDEIENELRNQESIEIPSKKIGELVMKKLKKIDQVAYIRFASVYREFKDIESFREELEKLKNAKG
ncbi:MAG: transcriptional regulator NrdR [Candidatus Aenigmatarchaeota archaeon]